MTEPQQDEQRAPSEPEVDPKVRLAPPSNPEVDDQARERGEEGLDQVSGH